MVKRNYALKNDQPLSDELLNKVKTSWEKAISMFRDFELLVEASDEKIITKEPDACFDI